MGQATHFEGKLDNGLVWVQLIACAGKEVFLGISANPSSLFEKRGGTFFVPASQCDKGMSRPVCHSVMRSGHGPHQIQMSSLL
jgi:hypothetical protein